ncbi:class I SAM-dependent methyltransferase [Saccharopolyspora phatthalungensis]|uniref:2-polyprenyl-3-methyl-5-hydroxy-6-metoxy-1, 4-benzoquinol methylase n=1 Tax=Saccharopolyspora phatthalungensis TaxID=664693 RepID=A0A840QIQ7_9PSEU|nr:class I SAM-dependent methyltransferase [Saccharopolyspora phatthalungensis]MBB5158788.1 2-polyprenyl-3-methyl-5-hydroxy-6-metoxy-1,4-benzoquinol methylase [Saccharopolyspora phatthalungensis]
MTGEAACPTDEEVAAEWARRAERNGLARVMRASQPAELNAGTTGVTRGIVDEYLRLVAADLRRPVATALEVGCGVGRLTPTLATHADRVTAIDMTPQMLDNARRNCADLTNVDFMLARAEDITWQASMFDVGVSVWVLMHLLDDEQLAKVCTSLAESLRYLVLIEYSGAQIPVSRWSRLRTLEDYLAVLPGAQVLQERSLDYGGDASTAALIRFPDHA